MDHLQRDAGALVLPALRCQMGDWVYYSTALTMCDIADRVSLAGEIHESKTLFDLIQREITDRSDAIAAYLIEREQRLFNAIVVAVYGGSPQWREVDLGDVDLPANFRDGVLGLLSLSGEERLFALDGQHRVMGIRAALQAKPELSEEDVAVIFIAHSNDAEGKERTRRLFTTLNRYAKPVNKAEIIALDEDDVVAIVVRRLLDNHRLFKDKVSTRKQKPIPRTDQANLTTIIALYDAVDTLIREQPGWLDYKKKRPSDEEVEEVYLRVCGIWDGFLASIPELRQVADANPSDDLVAGFRNQTGGHLLFRPVGLDTACKALRHLNDTGVEWPQAVERLARIPLEISEPPWAQLLWDPINGRVISSGEHAKAAYKVMIFGIGGDLDTVRSSEAELRKELSGLTGADPGQIALPVWTH